MSLYIGPYGLASLHVGCFEIHQVCEYLSFWTHVLSADLRSVSGTAPTPNLLQNSTPVMNLSTSGRCISGRTPRGASTSITHCMESNLTRSPIPGSTRDF